MLFGECDCLHCVTVAATSEHGVSLDRSTSSATRLIYFTYGRCGGCACVALACAWTLHCRDNGFFTVHFPVRQIWQVSEEAHERFVTANHLTGGFFVSAKSGENLLTTFYRVAAGVHGIELTDHELAFTEKARTMTCTWPASYPLPLTLLLAHAHSRTLTGHRQPHSHTGTRASATKCCR